MVYIKMFHGRKPIDKEMDDWGEEGPVFGPYNYVHTTYDTHVHLGLDHGDDEMTIIGGMLYYDGVWYGDWSIASGAMTKDWLPCREPFDKEKAEPK